MDDAARVRAAYETFIAGDGQPLRGLLAEDVVYHLPGHHLGGGTLRGRDAIFRRMAEAAGDFDAPPRVQLLALTGAAAFVISVERFSARRAGAGLDQEVCVVWRMQAGRCAEMWAHFADQPACDAFWDAAPS